MATFTREIEVEVELDDFDDDDILEYAESLRELRGAPDINVQEAAMDIYIAMIRKDPNVDSMVRKLIEEITGRIL